MLQLYEGKYKELHVKIFNTGKMEIPGVKDDKFMFYVLDFMLKNILNPLFINKNKLKGKQCVTKTKESGEKLHYLKNTMHTILINSNFSCNYEIKRDALFNLLKYKYNIGVIYDPIQQVLYSAVQGQGLWRNGQPWSTSSTLAQPVNQSLRFYCDCTFYSQPDGAELIEQMQLLASELGYAELLVKQGGGGVLNACRVLENAPACYFKKPKLQAGGGSLWDFAATACLFKQAAAPVSDFNGQPLDLNRRDSSFMNHRGVIYSSCWQLSAALQKL